MDGMCEWKRYVQTNPAHGSVKWRRMDFTWFIVYLISVALSDACLLGTGPRRCQHLLQLVLLEQVGNLARVQHVVDVLQELLHYNLRTLQTAH